MLLSTAINELMSDSKRAIVVEAVDISARNV